MVKLPPINVDGVPVSPDNTVVYPFDYSHLFYIDVPTSKWNSRVLYHIFKRLGVKNVSNFVWDPTECHSLYIIKDGIVHKTGCDIHQIFEYQNQYHPDFNLDWPIPDYVVSLNLLQKASIIVGIDNWIQQETYNGQIFDTAALMQDESNTTLINAIVDGFADYCMSLKFNVFIHKASTITDIVCKSYENWVCCIDKETGKKCTTINGDTAIHSSRDAFRYITINVKDNNVYIDVCTSFATTGVPFTAKGNDGTKTISINRSHGAGYQIISYPKNSAVFGFPHCDGDCTMCKKFLCKSDDPKQYFGKDDISLHHIAASHYECMDDKIEHAGIRCIGGMTEYFEDPIYPTPENSSKIYKPGLNSHKKPIYNNAEEISEADKVKTKSQSIMTAPTKNSLFERMLNKYKGQLIPTKIDGLSLTMDGNIALPNGPDEYVAIVGDHIENYPAEFIIQDIPFYSIQRPLNQVKVGDYVFLTTTAEGRKLAKVTAINKTKDGQPTGLTVLRFSGTKDETAITTDKLTGLTTVEVIINLFENFQFTGMGGDGQMNPIMMMAMMKDGFKGEGLEKLMMMSMAMGGNSGFNFQFPGMAGNGQMNPLMLMALMKDDIKGEGLEKLMMMSMFMGGNNPFAVMNPAPAEQVPARKPRSDKGVSRKPTDADTTAGKVEEPAGAE